MLSKGIHEKMTIHTVLGPTAKPLSILATMIKSDRVVYVDVVLINRIMPHDICEYDERMGYTPNSPLLHVP